MTTSQPQANALSHAISRRELLQVAGIALVYFAAQQIAFLFPEMEKIVAAIWPAAGIGLAALLLTPRRLWPVLITTFFAVGVISNLLADRSLLSAIGLMLANILESLTGAWIITTWRGPSVRFTHVNDITALLAVAVIINAGTAIIGSTTATLDGATSFWDFWKTWWISNGLGLLIVTPLIVTWSRLSDSALRTHRPLQIEFGTFMALWSVMTWVVFHEQSSRTSFTLQPYLLLALLTYAALRLRLYGVTLALTILVTIAISSDTVQNGPLIWGGTTPVERLLLTQLYLACTAITGLLLGTTFVERIQAEKALAASQHFIEKVVETTPDVVYIYDLQEQRNTYINREIANVLGYSPQNIQAMGSQLLDTIFHPDDIAAVAEHHQRLAHAHDEVFELEYRLKDAQGQWRWIHSRDRAFTRHKDGTVQAIIGTATDINTRRQVETALRVRVAQYHAITTASMDGFWIFDPDGRCLDVNETYCAMSGYSRDELLTMSVEELEARESRQEVKQHLTRVIQKGTDRFESRHRHKHGHLFDVEISATFLPETGQILAFVRNITAQKQADAALRASEAKYQLVFDNSGTVNSIFDTNYRLVLQNSLSIKALGLTQEEALGKDVFELFGPEQGAIVQKRMRRVIETQQAATYDTHFNLPSGPKWFRSTHQPLVDKQGITMGVQVISQDITAQKQAELELEHYRTHLEELVQERTTALEEANQQLRVLSRMKDEFIANVSHELRTPITALVLRQYLLRRHPEQVENHLSVMERETLRLEHTIEDLLQLSRLDQDRTQVTFDALDLNLLVAQYVSDRTLLAEQAGLTLTLANSVAIPRVRGDQGLLGQVLSILLTNAINYTPSGERIQVTIQTEVFDRAEWAGFSVCDTGLGIAPKEHDQLFERFFRGAVGRQSHAPGTGLGLAIAKEIIDRHQGRITVESTGVSGEGACFTVWLPADGEQHAKAKSEV